MAAVLSVLVVMTGVVVIVIVVMTVVTVVVAVVIVVVFLVVAVQQHRPVQRRAVLVDHLDVLQQPVQRLALADLGGELADGVLGLVGLADGRGLLADLQGDAGVLGVDVVLTD